MSMAFNWLYDTSVFAVWALWEDLTVSFQQNPSVDARASMVLVKRKYLNFMLPQV